MSGENCFIEQATRVAIGIALLIVAVCFLILGFSVLPITGVILAVPPFLTGILFLASPKSRACYRK